MRAAMILSIFVTCTTATASAQNVQAIAQMTRGVADSFGPGFTVLSDDGCAGADAVAADVSRRDGGRYSGAARSRIDGRASATLGRLFCAGRQVITHGAARRR